MRVDCCVCTAPYFSFTDTTKELNLSASSAALIPVCRASYITTHCNLWLHAISRPPSSVSLVGKRMGVPRERSVWLIFLLVSGE